MACAFTFPTQSCTALGPEAVGPIYTDASCLLGWSAAGGDRFIRGGWTKVEMREGINWQELWVLKKAMATWVAW